MHLFDLKSFAACKVSCNIGSVLTEMYSGLEDDLIKSMQKIKLTHVIDKIAGVVMFAGSEVTRGVAKFG